MFERIINAAVADTASKFRLAVALVLDIPGPRAGRTVTDLLREASEAIIAGGGEPRDLSTLAAYRDTALWVRAPETAPGTRRFRWVERASMSAHIEARRAGLPYTEFAAMPKHTVVAIREATGRRGYSFGSPDHTVNTTRDALADPVTARKVMADPTARRAAQAAIAEHHDARPAAHRSTRDEEELARALGNILTYGERLTTRGIAEPYQDTLAALARQAAPVLDWISQITQRPRSAA